MTDTSTQQQPCSRFPDGCPNLVDVTATDIHGGGVRCGCNDAHERASRATYQLEQIREWAREWDMSTGARNALEEILLGPSTGTLTAQRKVKRLDTMAQAWKEKLPDTIDKRTVVEAIHMVTRGDTI